MKPYVFYILKLVPIYFSCLGECSKAVLLEKLQKYFVDKPNLHQHETEQIRIQFKILGELILCYHYLSASSTLQLRSRKATHSRMLQNDCRCIVWDLPFTFFCRVKFISQPSWPPSANQITPCSPVPFRLTFLWMAKSNQRTINTLHDSATTFSLCLMLL